MFDSERNKQHKRVLRTEIRRLPNETIKQLAVRIEPLVRKAYSLNTHDFKNTKMTEILMMTLTPQLKKRAIKMNNLLFHLYMKINWNSFTITILDPVILLGAIVL